MGFYKLAALLFFAAYLQSVTAYCQVNPLTLSEKNVPLVKVLEEIKQKTGYDFFGEGDWPSMSHRVNFSIRNASLHQALDSCFKDQPLTYKLLEKSIAIFVRQEKNWLVHGWVFNEKHESLEGATILVRGVSSTVTVSKANGEFSVRMHYADDRLLISNVNYETQEIFPEEGKDLNIELKEKVGELADVVVLHTGYQDLSRKGTTGSFDKVDNELVNRRVSPNILDRIDGVTSSVIFNKNIQSSQNQSAITIRGRSTILSNPDPLIVVDNFPYPGDIRNINPDDVESITILKDAAAASIWGAFSGNGVIVITTKKGRINEIPKLSLNTSLTAVRKPDLYYQPILSSSDYIDVEQYLFSKGYYDGPLANLTYPVLSPVVEILAAQRNGTPMTPDAQTRINTLRGQDIRRDMDKYFYRTGLNSQYSLNLTGGNDRHQYFLSGGYDRDVSNLVRNAYDRITLNGNNTYHLLSDRLELSTGIAFTASTNFYNNSGAQPAIYPYVALADAHGNALPVAHILRLPYVDTVGGGQLLDWHYRPLDELRYSDNKGTLVDYRINIAAKYKIWKGLDASIYYQYGRGDADSQAYYSLQTWTARNLINSYTQRMGGNYSFPIPRAGILDETLVTYNANNVRVLLGYNDTLFRKGVLNAITGVEVRDLEGQSRQTRLYGYNKDLQSSVPVDYITPYTLYASGNRIQIPFMDRYAGTSDRYVSYYVNGAYTYLGKYTLSGSARRDESNLFGVKANQKGVPLWSAGGAWELSGEEFYRQSGLDSWLPFLKLRVTDGYNGNVNRSVSAYTTAYSNQSVNNYGTIGASIANPPNPNLRWERVNIINLGLDFSAWKDRLGGTIEYYIKTGKDLIAASPVDPTTGVPTFTGNTADMQDHGVDITLRANNNIGNIRWTSTLLFSFVRDKVTSYKEKQGTVSDYLYGGSINPLVGRPLYSTYALRWKGLDPNTGDPLGSLNGHTTNVYSDILGSTDLSNMVYKGPSNPPLFGGWRNNFNWKQWGLSFNMVYKFGYYFRRTSISYSALFGGSSQGHPDYERRWQRPGDEKYTNVPSLPAQLFPLDPNRDLFYANSEVLIEKADQVRLQDIQFSYDLLKKSLSRLPVEGIHLYVYVNNIGLVWKANHAGIDPDYATTLAVPLPRTFALGAKINF